MDKLLNYSSDSDSERSEENTKYVNNNEINQYSKENVSLKHKNNTDDDKIKNEHNDEYHEDLQALVEAEGLEVDHDLDISDLEKTRQNQKLNKFYTSNQVSTQKNHVSGHIEEYHMNAAKFHEQYHTFQNFGHAQDPSVTRGGHTISAGGLREVNYDQDAHGPKSLEAKQYKEQLKRKRKKAGEAGAENFLGPWAFYDDEEDFRVQKVVPTVEQEQMKEDFENKRQQKLDEKVREENNEHIKKKYSDDEEEGEAKEGETEKEPAVKSYSVFHGNVDKSQSKSFLTPPDYLTPAPHS